MGGFLKWRYPQIISFNLMFDYKPSSFSGTLTSGNTLKPIPSLYTRTGRPLRSIVGKEGWDEAANGATKKDLTDVKQ